MCIAVHGEESRIQKMNLGQKNVLKFKKYLLQKLLQTTHPAMRNFSKSRLQRIFFSFFLNRDGRYINIPKNGLK